MNTMDGALKEKIASVNELKKTTTELRDQLVNAKTSEEIREILKGKERKIAALGETAFKLDRRSDPDFDQWFEITVHDYYYDETHAEEIVEEFSNSTRPITHDQLTKRNTDKLIDILNETINKFQSFLIKVSRVMDTASVSGVEKEFLSEKVPKVVAERIVSNLSGKEGSIGAQQSQLRVEYGKPGVQGKKGGRKTKKKRSSKKKTHGRRV